MVESSDRLRLSQLSAESRALRHFMIRTAQLRH